jgi:hypothetical protein
MPVYTHFGVCGFKEFEESKEFKEFKEFKNVRCMNGFRIIINTYK